VSPLDLGTLQWGDPGCGYGKQYDEASLHRFACPSCCATRRSLPASVHTSLPPPDALPARLQAQLREVFATAVEGGITFFDTAEVRSVFPSRRRRRRRGLSASPPDRRARAAAAGVRLPGHQGRAVVRAPAGALREPAGRGPAARPGHQVLHAAVDEHHSAAPAACAAPSGHHHRTPPQRGRRRSPLTLGAGQVGGGFRLGRKAMLDALRASLARLGLDSVDLYQAWGPLPYPTLIARWQASVPGVHTRGTSRRPEHVAPRLPWVVLGACAGRRQPAHTAQPSGRAACARWHAE